MTKYLTILIPEKKEHVTTGSRPYNAVSLPKPPFDLEIDQRRYETAPRSSPVRSAARLKFAVASRRNVSEIGVMDMCDMGRLE